MGARKTEGKSAQNLGNWSEMWRAGRGRVGPGPSGRAYFAFLSTNDRALSFSFTSNEVGAGSPGSA
jgi:hypothetical protein